MNSRIFSLRLAQKLNGGHNHFQCCYCKGKLVDSGPHQGTYDYEKFDPNSLLKNPA